MEDERTVLEQIRGRVQRVAEARARQQRSGRLRWLVDFLKRDAPMREGERLDLSDDVLAFLGTSYVGINRDLTAAELADIQGSTRAGLNSWLSADRQAWPLGRYDGVDISLGFDWPEGVPPPSSALHNGLVFRPWARAKIVYSIPEEHFVEVKHAFFLATAQEVVAAGNRLKRCLWCASFFVSVRRQRYCSKSCTQEAMDARKPGREKLPRYATPTSTRDPIDSAEPRRRRRKPHRGVPRSPAVRSGRRSTGR